MATGWSTENVVAEFRDLQANTMAVDQSGRFALLAGRKALAIVELDRPSNSIKKHPRQSKWEIGTAEWNPTPLKKDLFAITCNQRAELVTCREGGLTLDHALKAHTRVISDLNWSPFEPHRLSTCSVDTFVHIWDIRDPKKPVVPLCAVAGASQVKWNKSRRHFLATSHDGDVRIWDERKGTSPVQYLAAHLSKIHGLDWSPIQGQDFQLATSSQDCTVKFWDVTSPCRPLNVLPSSSPVWRARYTPFGEGLITVVVPQLRRGENSLLLWNANSLVSPVHTFVGHVDVVLEFQWREHAEDIKEYQLITWSKDQNLRIWRIDQQLQRLCGHDVESYDNLDKISNSGLESIDLTNGTVGQSSVSSSRDGESPSRDSSSANDATMTVGVTGVVLSSRDDSKPDCNQSESEKTDHAESRDGIKNEHATPAPPNNLQREFKLLNRDIPNVRIEEMDAVARTCTFSATIGKNKVRIMLKFPVNYPFNLAPEMQFCKGTTVSSNTKDELSKTLRTTCQLHVKNSLSCLEPCLRNLVTTLENCALVEQRESSEIGSPYSMEITSSFLPSKMYGSYQDSNVPFPRTCGATFCGPNFLVCFARPPHMKGLRNGSDITPRSLSAISAYAGNSMQSLTHSGSTTQAYNFMYPPVAQSPTGDPNVSVSSLYYLDRRSKSRGKLRKEDPLNKNQKMGFVAKYDISKLLPIGRELAQLYVIDNRDIRDMCQKNLLAAASVGRKDLVLVWSLVLLSTNPVLSPSADPNVGMPWACHPFGRKLFQSLIRHYLPLGDIQTVAMLCCTLSSSFFPQQTKKSSSIIEPITASPGGSPYHTIHPGDTLLDGYTIGALLKSNRSNSWSDCLDDYDNRHGSNPLLDSKDIDKERHENSTRLLDPKLSIQYDEFKRIYAEILYQWNLLESRAEILKHVSTSIETNKRIEFVIDCLHCQRKVQGPLCGHCKNYSFQCAICHVAIKGAFNFCVVCGHGGHMKHMMQWFQCQKICPTGCGCVCLMESGQNDT